MTTVRQRTFAAFGAILFLITSSALTILVIWTMTQNSSSSSATSGTTSSTTSLAGTKLAGFTPTSVPLTGLKTTDLKVGTGAVVKSNDTITVDYEGALMKTGVIFDASVDHGGAQTLSLKNVIEGWSLGIPGMRVGGTRELLIPASLGYGSTGSGSTIPPNSDLVFDVTVEKID